MSKKQRQIAATIHAASVLVNSSYDISDKNARVRTQDLRHLQDCLHTLQELELKEQQDWANWHHRRPRIQVAHELAGDVMRGPSTLLTDQQKRDYNLWMSTWLLPKMRSLIPELERSDFLFASSANQEPVINGYTNNNKE